MYWPSRRAHDAKGDSEAFEIVRSERFAEVAPISNLAPIIHELQIAHELLELGPAPRFGEVGIPERLHADAAHINERSPHGGESELWVAVPACVKADHHQAYVVLVSGIVECAPDDRPRRYGIVE